MLVKMLSVVAAFCTLATVDVTSVSLKPCPQFRCLIFCEFGNEKNKNGCDTCECIDPCQKKKCPEGQECAIIRDDCTGVSCPPKVVCVPKAVACPKIGCRRPCKSGFRVDFKGCQTCECVDPCEYPPCLMNETCTSKEVICIRAPCYQVPECTARIPACPLPKCARICKSGYRVDGKGCQTCQCIDPCEYPKCKPKTVCVKQDVICKKEPCYPTYECIEKRDVCPMVDCLLPCKSGYISDESGCQTCKCNDPCEYSKCKEGQICQRSIVCIRDPCPSPYFCIDCPQIRCSRQCNSGFRKDENGCQTCECIDPCEYPDCTEGQICEKEVVECFVEPCYPVQKCIDCSLIKCSRQCNSGFRKDENGCQTCQCIDPCEESPCPGKCVTIKVQCIKAPCYPVYECVKENPCPQLLCLAHCVSGYRNDSKGCQTCECVDPCEYPKCEPGQVCVAKKVECIARPCYSVAQCIKRVCPLVKCIPCSSGYKRDKNGCQTCECLDGPKFSPCMTMKCSPGYKCIEIVNPCLIPPCPLRGECVPTTST